MKHNKGNRHKNPIKQIESILVKQEKQIRALYELHKSTNENVSWIQSQLKKQNDKNKNIDLSQKVFNVNNFI